VIEEHLVYQGNLIKATREVTDLLKNRKVLSLSEVDAEAQRYQVLTSDLLRELKDFAPAEIDWAGAEIRVR